MKQLYILAFLYGFNIMLFPWFMMYNERENKETILYVGGFCAVLLLIVFMIGLKALDRPVEEKDDK